MDADQETIKAAYRRAAQKNHPDKGGDETLFLKIQKAYEVLSDPVKRDRYDKTGDTNDQTFGQAEATLAALFHAVITAGDFSGDLIEVCKSKVGARLLHLKREMSKHEARISILQRQINRITCKKDNLYENLLKSEIDKLSKLVDSTKQEIDIINQVSGLLGEYTDTQPVEATTLFVTMGG